MYAQSAYGQLVYITKIVMSVRPFVRPFVRSSVRHAKSRSIIFLEKCKIYISWPQQGDHAKKWADVQLFIY